MPCCRRQEPLAARRRPMSSLPQSRVSQSQVSRPRISPLRRREAIEGFLWISPWIFGFLVFTFGPMIVSLYLSLTRYKIGDVPEWIGLANYAEAFFADKLFWPSLGRTIYFAVAMVV